MKYSKHWQDSIYFISLPMFNELYLIFDSGPYCPSSYYLTMTVVPNQFSGASYPRHSSDAPQKIYTQIGRDEKGCLLSTEKKAAVDVDRRPDSCFLGRLRPDSLFLLVDVDVNGQRL